jgi:hypothetical protein
MRDALRDLADVAFGRATEPPAHLYWSRSR